MNDRFVSMLIAIFFFGVATVVACRLAVNAHASADAFAILMFAFLAGMRAAEAAAPERQRATVPMHDADSTPLRPIVPNPTEPPSSARSSVPPKPFPPPATAGWAPPRPAPLPRRFRQ